LLSSLLMLSVMRVRIRISVDAGCEEIRNQDVYGCQAEDDRC
jgi:hypothetical protein